MKPALRILIIEDIAITWAKPMYNALEKLLSNTNIDIAENAEEAKQVIQKRYYHFISYDQHIKEKKQSTVETNIGIELCVKISSRYPCIRHIAYTAYAAESLQKSKITVWNKSQISEQGEGYYTAIEWAKAVKEILTFKENNYFSNYQVFYFSQARDYLPPVLAKKTDFIHNALQESKQTQSVQQSLYFCSLTLRLTLTQAFAIAGYNIAEASLKDDSVTTVADQLKTIIDKLKDNQQIDYWLPFLQEGNTDYITAACQQLITIKNNFYQSNSISDTELKQLFEEVLPVFMDMAAFWATYPLITNVKQMNDNIEYQVIKGRQNTWEKDNLFIKDKLELNDKHVYLCLENRLIDLYPFVFLKEGNVLAVSHLQNETAIHYSLKDGKLLVCNNSNQQ